MLQGTASAYVTNQRLCMLGIVQTPWGPVPFSHIARCEAEDGPIDFSRDLSEPVQKAIEEGEAAVMKKVSRDELTLAAEDLVDRARAGDQNAMATIAMVRQRAQQGIPRAQKAFKALMKYAKRNPPDSPFGFEETKSERRIARHLIRHIDRNDVNAYVSGLVALTTGLSLNTAGITLANGPNIENSRIRTIASTFSGETRKLFRAGYFNWQKKPTDREHPAVRIGRVIGYARALQEARLPDTPIGTLSKRAGWELD